MSPKHSYPVPEGREALAPYNFVPLPERIVPAEPLPSHDRYASDDSPTPRYTGRIRCLLKTWSPLYVRCGYTPSDFADHGGRAFSELTAEQQCQRGQFFHLNQVEEPAIPGSSLRGLLRTLVEIVGYGKVERVSERKPFFRSLGDPALKPVYHALFIEDCRTPQQQRDHEPPRYRTKVKAGFLRLRHGRWLIEECNFGRIDQQNDQGLRGIARIPRINGQALYDGTGPNRTPSWTYQHRTIYVRMDANEDDHFFPLQLNHHNHPRHNDLYLRFRAVREASFTPGAIPNAVPATLVLTGAMQHKHLEFVFPHQVVATHEVAQELIDRFHDDDQISGWQEKAFPKDRPTPNARQRDGWLRDGEPVFFLLNDDGTVRFLGRAQLFRLPYTRSPYDLVSANLRTFDGQPLPPDTLPHDLAEALFGYVRRFRRDQDQARAGRVFVGDAHWERAETDLDQRENPWLAPEPFTPRILGSPKPTTFQHYLTQQDHSQQTLRHYSSTPEDTAIRGHKLYWHQGNPSRDQIEDPAFAERLPGERQDDTQHTRFKPVAAGVAFTFDIHFENLSRVELGALLWVLRTASDPRYRLALGMGKPFGMGAVSIQPTVTVTKRSERYRRLFADSTWDQAEQLLDSGVVDECVAAFNTYVLTHSGEQGSCLEETLRIQCLLLLLLWDTKGRKETRSMEIERDARQTHIAGSQRYDPNKGHDVVNEYSRRPVLPWPQQVVGRNMLSKLGFHEPPHLGPQNNAPQGRYPQRRNQLVDGSQPVRQETLAQDKDLPSNDRDTAALYSLMSDVERMRLSDVAPQMRRKVDLLLNQSGPASLRKRVAEVILAKAREAGRKVEQERWYPLLAPLLTEHTNEGEQLSDRTEAQGTPGEHAPL